MKTEKQIPQQPPKKQLVNPTSSQSGFFSQLTTQQSKDLATFLSAHFKGEIEYWKLPKVMKISGYSKPSLYRKMKEGTFPPAKKIGARAIAWRSDEIIQWVESRQSA